jgi:hypothetical protein
MATICQFRHQISNEPASSAIPVTDREVELTAILAVAQVAYDKVYRAQQDLAAA